MFWCLLALGGWRLLLSGNECESGPMRRSLSDIYKLSTALGEEYRDDRRTSCRRSASSIQVLHMHDSSQSSHSSWHPGSMFK